MIKLSRTGITALKRQYRSVLLKCLLINAGILLAAGSAMAVDPTITLPGTAGAVNGVSGAGSDVTYTIVEGKTETTHAIATVDKITEDISALITTKETNISGTMGFDITKNPANTSEANSLVSKLTGPNAGDQTSIVGAINAVDNAVGALSGLTTDAKGNLVAAINEIDAHADANATNIGTLGGLTTDAKTDLVAAINEIDAHADANATAIANAITGATRFTGLKMDNNADTPGTTTANKIDDGSYNGTAATTLATNATVGAAITKERTATATLTNKTIDADDNTISDLTTANLKSGVLQTTVRAAGTATDTNLVSELAVRTALDSKTDLVDTNTAGNKAKVDVDATNKQITMKVTDTDGSTPLAGLTVNGTNQSIDVTGKLVAKGGLTVGDTSYGIASTGAADVLSLKVGGSSAITSITDSSKVPALLADITTASDNKLMTEKAVVTGISTVLAQKEQWAQGLLGVDTTKGTANQLPSALATLAGADSTVNHIDANTFAGALHELDVEKAGLDLDNTFTGNNTFNGNVTLGDASTDTITVKGTATFEQQVNVNAGIKVGTNTSLVDGTLTVGDGTNSSTLTSTALTTTTVNAGANTTLSNNSLVLGNGTTTTTLSSSADGLNVNTGLKVNGNETVTGSFTAGGGKFQVSDAGRIQDVRGIDISNGSTTAPKVSLYVTDDGTNSTLNISDDVDIAGSLKVGASDSFTVSDTGAITKVAGITSQNDVTVTSGTANDPKFVAQKDGSIHVQKHDGSAYQDMFSVDNNGAVITKGTVNVNGATLTGSSTQLSVDKKFLVTGNEGADISGTTELDKLKFTGAPTVDAIDVSGINVSSAAAAATTLATGATVYLGAENAKFTSTETTLEATTIKGALNELGAENAAQNTVLGAVMKANGTADTSKLTLKTHTGGDVNDLTTAVNLIGDLKSTGINAATLAGQIGAITAANVKDRAAGQKLVATATLSDNLHALDAAIGAKVSNVKGNLDDTKSVNENLDLLDVAVGDRKYVNNAAVSYDAITAGTDLTVAVSQVASNIGSKMVVANATASATVADRATAAFQTKTTNTVNQNLSALDAAIGTDTDLTTATATIDARGANNGVVVGNSVNANIATLNSAVGDLMNLHRAYAAGASIGNAITNGGTGTTNNVVDALNNIDATLGTIHGLKAKLAAAGKDYGNLAAGTTVEQHLTSLDAAIGDRSQFATGRYVASSNNLADATMALDKGLSDLADDVRDFKKEFKSGMAQMAAMSALVPNARAHGNTQISVGTGAYNGHTAAAVGGFHWVNDNLLLNAGVSYGNSNDVAYRAGLTWSW